MASSVEQGLIRWRVARELKGRGVAQLVGYIDGRTCMNLLDKEDENWQVQHTPIIANGELIGAQADLTVNGVTRSDVGEPTKHMAPIKGAYSDALKRAAVHFGIGRELYELPQVYAAYDPATKTPTQKPRFNLDNGRWEIDAPGWVWYPGEELDPESEEDEALGKALDTVKVLIASRPDLKGAVKHYVDTNNLDKTKASDMQKLADWLEVEANREVK